MLPISSEKGTVPKRLVFLKAYKCVGYGLFRHFLVPPVLKMGGRDNENINMVYFFCMNDVNSII